MLIRAPEREHLTWFIDSRRWAHFKRVLTTSSDPRQTYDMEKLWPPESLARGRALAEG